jgi:ubiquinone/menaquinone biosynthesis C-methylase UbiE
MQMNRIETWAVNNPLRAMSQRWLEAPLLRRLGGRLDGGTALELGCGRGLGVPIILDDFGAARMVGLDLDPAQVVRARASLRPGHRGRVELRVGDAARLDFPDQSFDGVFDFAILHHVPPWREALAEVRRVLRPGGRFYFVEVLRGLLETRLVRTLFVHPEEAHFSAAEFLDACARAGLVPCGAPMHLGSYFFLGAATR